MPLGELTMFITNGPTGLDGYFDVVHVDAARPRHEATSDEMCVGPSGSRYDVRPPPLRKMGSTRTTAPTKSLVAGARGVVSSLSANREPNHTRFLGRIPLTMTISRRHVPGSIPHIKETFHVCQ